MALSPEYGWPEPDNSSLVKNGAQDIRALGDAIDTSVWNVGYGQAGKNKIINGDFNIWQRGTSFNTTGAYTADRFRLDFGGTAASATVTQQTFTPGSAPVNGYEGKYFSQVATTAGSDTGSYITYEQRIEDVQTFAGQTVTISLWAKATSGTPKLGLELIQGFGSGGSAAVFGIGSTTVTLSTSWERYSFVYSVPSISGKTIGTSSNLVINFWLSNGSTLSSRSGNPGLQSNTFQFWGVQVEYGSKATPFQTATGTLQGELAACQRYYWRVVGPTVASNRYGYPGVSSATTTTLAIITNPVVMRIVPTAVEFFDLIVTNLTTYTNAVTALTLEGGTTNTVRVTATATGQTTNQPTQLGFVGPGYIAFSSEL
jgi:hypothetical protein